MFINNLSLISKDELYTCMKMLHVHKIMYHNTSWHLEIDESVLNIARGRERKEK